MSELFLSALSLTFFNSLSTNDFCAKSFCAYYAAFVA